MAVVELDLQSQLCLRTVTPSAETYQQSEDRHSHDEI
jgi:hypothetical protein